MIESLLWSALWQSAAWLAVGLVASSLLARQPARAHAALLLALVAAALTTILGSAFRLAGVGLLPGLTHSLDVADLAARLAGGEGVPVPVAGLTVAHLVAAAWLALSAAALLRLGLSVARGRRLLAASRPARDGAVVDLARRAAARLALPKAPGVSISRAISCPVIWCWGSEPRLVLPEDGPRGSAAFFGVLCHEMAHLKRRDHWARLAAHLALCVLPWNPLAWIALRRLDDLREVCCDAWALDAGASPTEYAEALLALAGRRFMPLANAAAIGSMSRRIRAILDGQALAARSGRGFMALAASLTLLLLCGAALGHRRPPTIDVIDSSGLVAMDAAPDVITIPRELDLGVGDPGRPRSRDLLLCNRSRTPRVVFSATPACSCTTVSPFEPTELSPGECMKVEVTMTADPVPGADKTRFVTFEIEGQPPLKLAIHLRAAGTS